MLTDFVLASLRASNQKFSTHLGSQRKDHQRLFLMHSQSFASCHSSLWLDAGSRLVIVHWRNIYPIRCRWILPLPKWQFILWKNVNNFFSLESMCPHFHSHYLHSDFILVSEPSLHCITCFGYSLICFQRWNIWSWLVSLHSFVEIRCFLNWQKNEKLINKQLKLWDTIWMSVKCGKC